MAIPLGKVGGLTEKLGGVVRSGENGLFSLYVSEEQFNDEKDGTILRSLNQNYLERMKSQQAAIAQKTKDHKDNHQEPLPIQVVAIKTIQDALDALLVTNRHLRKWHGFSRVNWEKKWRPGTADLATLLKQMQPGRIQTLFDRQAFFENLR